MIVFNDKLFLKNFNFSYNLCLYLNDVCIESLFEHWNTIEEGYFDALPRAYQQIRQARTLIFDSMVKVCITYVCMYVCINEWMNEWMNE